MSKPREWWAVDESTDASDKEDRWLYGRFQTEPYNHLPETFQIKVIEKSAYDRLVKENEGLKNPGAFQKAVEYTAAIADAALLRSMNADLIKEIEELRAENERLKAEYADYVRGKPGEWYVTQLQKEVDELRTCKRELLEALSKYKGKSAPMNLQNWPNDTHHFFADEALQKWGEKA